MGLDWEILPNVNQYCCNIYFLNLLGCNLTEYLSQKGSTSKIEITTQNEW